MIDFNIETGNKNNRNFFDINLANVEKDILNSNTIYIAYAFLTPINTLSYDSSFGSYLFSSDENITTDIAIGIFQYYVSEPLEHNSMTVTWNNNQVDL